jgi:uncharacterized phage protein (TIGR01671 family)
MNRELKFRILDKLNRNEELLINNLGKIFVIDQGCGQANEADDQENYVIRQYTGLKDKNGKEIYEGDIVKHRKHNKEVRIGAFSDGVDERTGVFLQDPKIKHINFGTNRLSSFSSCEIIGNVFENPELTK